ncbi:uncharacterized protein LOC143076506 [Mytilus galloprovincialis]|uniref:uncharacterized protein LOC143076506 n=1 Tax=Mytilus galloprovincialis TaxID=29158 RepID=UPI003F7B62EA
MNFYHFVSNITLKMFCKIILCLLPIAFAQVPIPHRPLGFVYKWGNASAPVDLDVYLDNLCPDSAETFPTIQKVADYYGPKQLRLRIHLFPLPYHHNSFLIAMGTRAVDQLTKTNMTYTWVQQIYNNIVKFSDVTLTQAQVVTKMTELAKSMGMLETEFMKLATDEMVNEDCRVAWKYACSRGVTGTPTFMINDVVVAADPAWQVSEWNKVVDPLLKKSLGVSRTRDCTGKKRCEYLPGKIECCKPGEACIPNVGCRC